jgi:hypothetical protein
MDGPVPIVFVVLIAFGILAVPTVLIFGHQAYFKAEVLPSNFWISLVFTFGSAVATLVAMMFSLTVIGHLTWLFGAALTAAWAYVAYLSFRKAFN